MTTQLTQRGAIPNPSSLELPKLQMYEFPPFLRGAKGMEAIERHSEMLREARAARTTAEIAKRDVAEAAAADADAQADALIAGTKPPKSTLDDAIATANEAHREAYGKIVAANKLGAEAVETIGGEAGAKLAEADHKRGEARKISALNHLDAAANDLADYIQCLATPAWIEDVRNRTGMDRLAGRSLPYLNLNAHAVTEDGTNPIAQLDSLRAAVAKLGGGGEREAA